MPYYIYKINAGPTILIKNLEKLAAHDEYKAAQKQVRKIRAEQLDNNTASYKIIFASNELAAEEQLMEHREAPIIREWEK